MKLFVKIVGKLASVLFIAMCLMVFIQVVMRYVFNKPIYWAEEFSLSAFTWVAFIGAALALRKSRHARITLLIDRFPEALRRKVEMGGHALVAAISVLIFYQSVKYNGLAETITLPALNVPQSFVSFGITFSAVLMFIFSIEAIVDTVRKKARETGTETKL
jgi:TRAP-type C4-dicarboxylate transport system permease small subunit